jgi:hypothetical protein
MLSFQEVHFTKKMGGACGMQGKKDKSVQGFGGIN